MGQSYINLKDIKELLSYIDSYWQKIIIKPKRQKIGKRIIDAVLLPLKHQAPDDPHTISVPFACIVPNDKKFKYIFYWDSYFMFQGVLGTKHEWIIPQMVENFIYLFKKYHIIPNFTHPESLGRSQPPFLTSMIFDAYDVLGRQKGITSRITVLVRNKKKWLRNSIDIAMQEYNDVWMNGPLYNHYEDEYHLNRYGNRDTGYALPSELESGWDMTSRFYNRCNEFLPVDLNCFLYKYEKDFAKAAEILGDKPQEVHWLNVAESRRKRMQIFWNNSKGFFYDFDYINKTQSTFESLAGFVPMWAAVATKDQAAQMVQHLPKFETDYGLAITSQDSLLPTLDLSAFPKELQITIQQILQPKQWDYPNIWPPLEYLTVVGLLHYGFIKDAKRIIEKSLATYLRFYKKHQSLPEKLDGTTGEIPGRYWYPTQLGFGWTNAVVSQYIKLLSSLKM